MISFLKFLLEFQSHSKLTLYHGTNSNFNQFSSEKSRVANDFFGGGVAYLADSKGVALTYAKSMTRIKKSGEPIIMTVGVNFRKVFDIDSDFTGKELISLLPDNLETFARGAGLLKLGVDKYQLLNNLKNGRITLTGKQIFMGLSQGMSKTSLARDFLISKGYDALKYNGLDTSNNHSVYIAYDNDDLKILKKEKLAK